MKKTLMFKNALKQARHGFNRPFMVMFETTLHCNMKCGYCAIWQNQQPEDRAMRERVFARMDEAADFGVFAWSFSGGEPLMNPHVPDYIEYAAKKGFYTSMPTNGLALKKCAEACAKLDQLEVSIDTLDREKFAKRRGIDGLPTILAALDHLLGTYKRNTIQINAAVDLDNLEDLRSEGARTHVIAAVDGSTIAEAVIYLGLMPIDGNERIALMRDRLADAFPGWFDEASVLAAGESEGRSPSVNR